MKPQDERENLKVVAITIEHVTEWKKVKLSIQLITDNGVKFDKEVWADEGTTVNLEFDK